MLVDIVTLPTDVVVLVLSYDTISYYHITSTSAWGPIIVIVLVVLVLASTSTSTTSTSTSQPLRIHHSYFESRLIF